MDGYCSNHVNLEIYLATSLLNWRRSIVEEDQKLKFLQETEENLF